MDTVLEWCWPLVFERDDRISETFYWTIHMFFFFFQKWTERESTVTGRGKLMDLRNYTGHGKEIWSSAGWWSSRIRLAFQGNCEISVNHCQVRNIDNGSDRIASTSPSTMSWIYYIYVFSWNDWISNRSWVEGLVYCF